MVFVILEKTDVTTERVGAVALTVLVSSGYLSYVAAAEAKVWEATVAAILVWDLEEDVVALSGYLSCVAAVVEAVSASNVLIKGKDTDLSLFTYIINYHCIINNY